MPVPAAGGVPVVGGMPVPAAGGLPGKQVSLYQRRRIRARSVSTYDSSELLASSR